MGYNTKISILNKKIVDNCLIAEPGRTFAEIYNEYLHDMERIIFSCDTHILKEFILTDGSDNPIDAIRVDEKQYGKICDKIHRKLNNASLINPQVKQLLELRFVYQKLMMTNIDWSKEVIVYNYG